MLDLPALQLAVAHADVIEQVGFHRSTAYWQTGKLEFEGWTKHVPSNLREPLCFDSESTLLNEGDCLADITAPKGALIHILGDLKAKITVDGHSEIVIAGDCGSSSTIDMDGIAHLFVGGSFSGRINSKGSALAWINKNCDGRVCTGTPSTKLYVSGDMSASISPTEKAALLYLVVHGFAPKSVLEATADCQYTEFNASVGISDCPPGIYPDRVKYDRLREKRSYVRWVVHRQRSGNGNP